MPKFILLSFLAMLVSASVSAQNVDFTVIVTDYDTEVKSKTAFVNVYSNVFKGKYPVDSVGKVFLKLEDDHTYKIEACDSGKVCRYVMVQLSEEKSGNLMGTSIYGRCRISLFLEEKGVNYEYVLKNPITVFSYDSDKIELVYDVKKASNMSAEIARIRKIKDTKDGKKK